MKKQGIALLLAALLLALLAGCGTQKYAAQRMDAPMEAYREYDDDVLAAEEIFWADTGTTGMEQAPAPMPTPASFDPSAETRDPAKLIYTADLDLETKAFDDAVSALTKLTASVGGYFASSSVRDAGAYRWARYTVRVPAEQYRAFLDQAGEGCHIRSLQEQTEDVSERYYDTAGRLETQRTKLARLQELLQQAKNMEDIITLEDAISETEETIDRLSGELRHYDALVDYSTVDVYLEEVRVYEPEPDPTFGSRLGAAFSDGLQGFVDGLGNLLVVLAYSWLWLVLIAAVVVLILWLTRKSRAARRQARQARKEKAAQPAAWSEPEKSKDDPA